VTPRTRALLAALVTALLVLAFLNRFVQDDAFISFRYARNLVRGNGLTWNPGERVEGYTNFLWTLLLAVPFALGLDPVAFSEALGLVCFAGTLLSTFLLARRLLGSDERALLPLLLLGTNYTFLCYATGGLETQMQAFLVTEAARRIVLLRSELAPRTAGLVALSIVLAMIGHDMMYGPMAAYFSELFGTRVRYSGASLGSQLSSVVAGGLSPFIATMLLPYGPAALASYLVVMAALTVTAVLAAAETRDRAIE